MLIVPKNRFQLDQMPGNSTNRMVEVTGRFSPVPDLGLFDYFNFRATTVLDSNPNYAMDTSAFISTSNETNKLAHCPRKMNMKVQIDGVWFHVNITVFSQQMKIEFGSGVFYIDLQQVMANPKLRNVLNLNELPFSMAGDTIGKICNLLTNFSTSKISIFLSIPTDFDDCLQLDQMPGNSTNRMLEMTTALDSSVDEQSDNGTDSDTNSSFEQTSPDLKRTEALMALFENRSLYSEEFQRPSKPMRQLF